MFILKIKFKTTSFLSTGNGCIKKNLKQMSYTIREKSLGLETEAVLMVPELEDAWVNCVSPSSYQKSHHTQILDF